MKELINHRNELAKMILATAEIADGSFHVRADLMKKMDDLDKLIELQIKQPSPLAQT
jgi:hypothetical protein